MRDFQPVVRDASNREVPPPVVSNSEKSKCLTMFGPFGGSVNAALRAWATVRRSPLVVSRQRQSLFVQDPQDTQPTYSMPR